MEETPERLRALPSWLLSQVSAGAHRRLAEAFGQAGTTGYQYRLLTALAEFGPASQTDLGRRVSLDRSDVAEAVAVLVERGCVTRAPDPADGRRNIVTLTAAGRRLLARLDRTVARVQDSLLAALTASERATLVDLLARVAAAER